MHGRGISSFLNTYYEGDFELNMKSGKGRMEYADGQVYVGDFGSGKPRMLFIFIFNWKESIRLPMTDNLTLSKVTYYKALKLQKKTVVNDLEIPLWNYFFFVVKSSLDFGSDKRLDP